jgi:hypothetical protein
MKRRILAVLPLIVAVALIGGCGQRSHNGDVGKGASTPAGDGERMRQFAKCMREHGVDMPDPDANGGGAAAGQEGKGVDAQTMADARQACRQYLPNGGEPTKLDPALLEQLRAFTKCMRDNGVNMPDPGDNGQVSGTVQAGDPSTVNPDDPAYKAAEGKCKQHLPTEKAGRP